MEEKTLTALQASIKKWEAIVDGTGEDNGTDNCALCQEFVDKTADADEPSWARDGCLGCPVAERVGTDGCQRTPYQKWSSYSFDKNGQRFPYRVKDEMGKTMAQEELDFLRSLVPQATA